MRTHKVTDWLMTGAKVLLGGACLVLVLSFVCSLMITGYRTWGTQYLGPDELGVKAERFSVTGAGDAPICGLFVCGKPGMPVLVASHGIADCKEGILPFLLPFIRDGYGVAVYDLRHHNESGGRHCTLGYWETEDLGNVTEHVRAQLAPGRPIVYWGFSLGGTVSLLAAARDKGIRAVVAHCPFVSMRAVVAHYLREFYHIPAWPVMPLALRFVEWRTGARAAMVDLRAAATALQDTPVLLFGSTDDRQVPLAWLQEIATAIGPRAELVVGPYGHADGMIAENEGLYDERDIDVTRAFLAQTTAARSGASGGAMQ
jgi:alpha-beta hydrolase superfamily lysophospholipase